jgi:hypothetical protein
MPGFDLARRCAEQFAADVRPNTIGMVLMNHGIFSFGKTAQESYERMIDLVTWAENYLAKHKAWDCRNQTKSRRRNPCAGNSRRCGSSFPPPPVSRDPRRARRRREPRLRAPRGCRHDLAAGPGHAGPRDPHQAPAHDRARRDGLCRGVQKIFQRARAEAKEPKTMLDPARAWCSMPNSACAPSGAQPATPPSPLTSTPIPWRSSSARHGAGRL